MYSLTSFCYSKSKNHSNKTEQIYIHINLLISNVNLKTSGQVINNFLFFLDKKKKDIYMAFYLFEQSESFQSTSPVIKAMNILILKSKLQLYF